MISNIPSPYSPAIAPQVSLTRASVGQESSDLKTTVFRPTEQLSTSVRTQTRRDPDDRPTLDAEKSRLVYSRESLKEDVDARSRLNNDAEQRVEGRVRSTDTQDVAQAEQDAPKGIESEEERQAKQQAAAEEKAEQDKAMAKHQAEQLALDQRRARSEMVDEQIQRNLDVARQLAQIGAYKPSSAAGVFLDKTI
jgi:hypothetical protein